MLRIVCLAMLMSTSAFAQYGGPPMWDRRPPYWDQDRWDRRQPPPRPYGPQMEPCIYHGDCRGPRDRDFNDPRPYPMPPYPRYDY